MFSKKKKAPNEVFTPKKKDVNKKMYISRDNLEKQLKSEIDDFYHIIIKGESGSGKTWLYKKVLDDCISYYETINLSQASMNGSITDSIINRIGKSIKPELIEYSEGSKAEASAIALKGGIHNTKKFSVRTADPLEECFKAVRKKAGKKPCFIVFDNLEAIFNNTDLMKELGNLILLLDDDNYAEYNVKFIIVGVPSGVKEYFSKVDNTLSISNRLVEIPEVSKLNLGQVENFVELGFREELNLNYSQDELKKIAKHIYKVTLGIPQRLHEYCLILSKKLIDKDWVFEEEILLESDRQYLIKHLSSTYGHIEEMMNSNETKIKRRDQVLFALSLIESDEFKVIEVEEIVRCEFESSTNGKLLNMSQILEYLTKADNPIIKKIKGSTYRFVNPFFRICVRAMLNKTNNEKVEKLPIHVIENENNE
jgi:SpoVK/Ycf46/Vps4 family AAA+-type ATPase